MIKDPFLTNLDPGMAKDPSPKLLLEAETGAFSYLVHQKYTIKLSVTSQEKETDRYK